MLVGNTQEFYWAVEVKYQAFPFLSVVVNHSSCASWEHTENAFICFEIPSL